MGNEDSSKTDRIADLVLAMKPLEGRKLEAITSAEIEDFHEKGCAMDETCYRIKHLGTVFKNAALLTLGTLYAGAVVDESMYYVGGIVTLINLMKDLTDRGRTLSSSSKGHNEFFSTYSRLLRKARTYESDARS